MKFFVGPLTWAFVIIVGGLMITPEGITPIVTNPGLRIAFAVISIGLGVAGFISMRGGSTRG
ncbi:MAG: hypothetical protein K8R76_06205 [Candidatus Aegiribacteria sp.]|nr:hypothetical protein [Candidatus Aegiribacteria sp.]